MSGPFIAKSVIVDIANNYGETTYMVLSSIVFYNNGQKVILTPDMFEAYSSSNATNEYLVSNVFNTSTDKTLWAYNVWQTAPGQVTKQRLVLNLHDPISFTNIEIFNSISNTSERTDRGVKDAKISITLDNITSTVYDAPISNAKLIFDGQFLRQPIWTGVFPRVGANMFSTVTTPLSLITNFSILGTVTNGFDFLSRAVHLYRRSDGYHIGQQMSDVATGTFNFKSIEATEHFIVCLPVDGEKMNAQIFDRVMPTDTVPL